MTDATTDHTLIAMSLFDMRWTRRIKPERTATRRKSYFKSTATTSNLSGYLGKTGIR